MNDNFLSLADITGEERLDASCIDSLPLAMAYVPMQKWRDI